MKRIYLILIAALVLRLLLIADGGQMFVPDEVRIERAYHIIREGSFERLFNPPEHPGYVILALPPMFMQGLISAISGADILDLYWVSALFFSLFSLGNIYLILKIAQRAGATENEALIAAALMALSNSMTYWSRHVLGYDAALFFAMLALLIGLKQTPRSALLAGLYAGFAFLIYNAYWLIAGVCLLMALISTRKVLAQRAGMMFVGGILPVLIMTLIRPDWLPGMLSFSETVTQGDFSRGGIFIWEYLWHAEHFMLALWLIALVALVFYRPEPRVLYALFGLLAVVGLLFVGSVILEKFVVYGRTARQVVPFFALITAFVVCKLPHTGQRAFLAAAVLAAIINFIPLFGIHWPRDVERMVYEQYGPFNYDYTVTGSGWKPIDRDSQYTLYNSQPIYPAVEVVTLPPGDILLDYPHPWKINPFYLYEGLKAHEIEILLRTDLRLILLKHH